MSRGQLRIYLGAAPGVGKTYAMLAEGQRRQSRGTDVVGALIEPHGRRLTAQLADGLEVIPRKTIPYRGGTFTEMDLDAVLARHPQVALVDEYAHANVPGCRNAKRWQDVEELLDAGIVVITTLNIQHLESLSDVACQITGFPVGETIPDQVARRADQVELVDMTPEALRRRMVHGNVYPSDRIEAALTHYFRPGNLTALRELALLWVADRVEEGLQRYRADHGIAAPWETNERILVGISGNPGDAALIRRAGRIAARTPGSELIAVHVRPDDGMTGGGTSGGAGGAGAMAEQRALVAAAGGSFRVIPGDDVAAALLAFAQAEDATQMVLGASRRSRLRTLLAGRSIPSRLTARAGHIDVHLVGQVRASGYRASLGELIRRALPRARRARARQENAVATALTRLAVGVLAGHGDAPALLEEMRVMFGLAAVSLLERRDGSSWYVLASAGDRPPEGAGTDVEVQVSDTLLLAGRGRRLREDESLVLRACAIPLVAGIERHRHEGLGTSDGMAGTRSRWTVLAATVRDAEARLTAAREALTAIAANGSDRQALKAAWRALHRMQQLVDDLGDLSRLHAGALETYLRPVELDDVLAAAIEDLGPGGHDLTVGALDDLPDVIADAALLTRVLTSLLADALAEGTLAGEASSRPAVTSTNHDGRVEIRITGCRVGIARLPVRLARDLTEAMGGVLTAEEPRTIVISLPASFRNSQTMVKKTP